MIPVFTAAATAITRALGEDATYTAVSPAGTIGLRAVIERDIVTPIPGMEGMTMDRRTVATVRASDLTGRVPALGDTITVGAEVFKVLAIEQDDGYLIQLKVRKQ